jgi:hypothetical protein
MKSKKFLRITSETPPKIKEVIKNHLNHLDKEYEESEDWFDRRLRQVLPDIKRMKSEGFNPIGYSVMFIEDTFYFKTKEEALRAYQYFEVERRGIAGWWYGIEEKDQNAKDYLESTDSEPRYTDL